MHVNFDRYRETVVRTLPKSRERLTNRPDKNRQALRTAVPEALP